MSWGEELMTMRNLKKDFLDFCKTMNLDTVGFTQCREFHELVPFFMERKAKELQNEFEEAEIEKRINPFLYMPEGKTIISIAFPYLFDETEGENRGFSLYTHGEDYHRVVKSYLNRAAEFIESLGGRAVTLVDNNCLPERYIAFLSGIGFVGKNNMLITEKYGSFVFLGEIITDIDMLQEDEAACIDWNGKFQKMLEYSKCGNCSSCINSCPTKAIADNCKNSNTCLSYITQKKNLEDIWLKKLEGRIFGCDSCQHCCPHNIKAAKSLLEAFKPYSFMKNINLRELASIDNKNFKEYYSKTSSGWRGKNILMRNALIELINKGEDIDMNAINSPSVKEHCTRLLKLI
jgi:epoxyqueuosine reductase